MIKHDFAQTFGTFGVKLSEAIAPHTEELADLLRSGDDAAFKAKQEEVDEIVYQLFRTACIEFADAMAGYLAFHGGNQITVEQRPLSQALVTMASNAANTTASILSKALLEAEEWLSHAVVAQADLGALIDDLLEQLGDPQEWVVTEATHPLADLFKSKMDA